MIEMKTVGGSGKKVNICLLNLQKTCTRQIKKFYQPTVAHLKYLG